MMIVQCCQCGKIEDGNKWSLPSPELLKKGKISHTYCPDCCQQALKDIELYMELKRAASAAA
ncbi:MAG: hypothetical protein ABIH23_33450 [bacterium]